MDATIYRWPDGSEALEEELGPCGCGPDCDHPEAVAIPVRVEVDLDGDTGEVVGVSQWAQPAARGALRLTRSEQRRLVEQAQAEQSDAAIERAEWRAEEW